MAAKKRPTAISRAYKADAKAAGQAAKERAKCRAARQAPAARAREVAGLGPKTVTVPPARYRRFGDMGTYSQIGTYPGIGNGIVAARTPAARTPESVTLTPPPHVVRRQVGLGLPSSSDLFEAVAGALGGALISAVFISIVPSPTSKFVAAALTGSLGVMLAATSPLGTIPSELGMGATAASGSFLYFDLTGQVKAPTVGAVWRPTAGSVDWVAR